ncbi:MAG TPA: hypothetical protein VFK05_13335 [Polyangiaceae bacterium]|nr:hypothetical protein [Polyangiaceae bacterium]
MSFGFKLIPLSVLALYLTQACVPDLDSLAASYSATNYGGTGGTSVQIPEGGSGDDTSVDNTSNGGSAPAPDTCSNNKQDAKESDVDCGGISKCERCGASSKCTANNDCESAYCKHGTCTTPTCDDGIKNQDETSVDCGGHCDPCEIGLLCDSDLDCAGEYCLDNGKNKVCADHCTSDVKEADETDIDCGGSCDPCADDKGCRKADDCTSGNCSNQHCQKPSCSDGIQNQNESATDCGGVCATTKPCAVGVSCNNEADCESWICSSATGKCVADTTVVGANDIIDDFEDGDFVVSPLGGRVGNWYIYGDGTGIQSFDVMLIDRGASKKGIHTKGKDFTKWGAGMGTDMLSAKTPYNAGAYSGVTFWARAAATLPVLIVFPDVDTDPGGKLCTTCDHHYNKTVQVTTGWQRFTVNFTELTLESGTIPEPTAFKPDGLISVQFRMAPSQTYELFVDDLAFVKAN